MTASSLENKVITATNIDSFLASAPKADFPGFIQPMLATLVDKPFNEPGWQYEIKWDGYRALAYVNQGEVNIYREIINHSTKNFTRYLMP